MLKNIRIENFRGFPLLEAQLTPVVVLLGPNSSGKTTALHAIRLACELIQMGVASDSSLKMTGNKIHVARDTLLEAPSSLLPLLDWQALFMNQQVSEGTSFQIRLEFEESDKVQLVDLKVSHARNRQLKFSLDLLAPDAQQCIAGLPSRSPKIGQNLTEWVKQHAPQAIFIPPFYGVVREEERRVPVIVDKLVGSGDQSHVVRNLIVDLDPSNLVQLNAFLGDVVGATISYRTSGDRLQTETPLRVEFKDTNGPIELSAAGAGLVNLVALYASLARWQKNAGSRTLLYLLDEPEAHLHPRLQGEMAQRIASLVTREFGNQLLMATHSVEIINRLANEPVTTLLRTDRTATPSAVVLDSQQEIIEELQEWADLTPFAAINFLASRRLLFHEGPDDGKFLRRCAQVYYRQLPRKREAFERWTLVPLGGVGQERLPRLLAKLLASPVWASRGGEVNLMTVLDRDWSRTPGCSVVSEPGATEIVQTIWPRHSIESLFVESNVLYYWVKALVKDAASTELVHQIQAAIQTVDQDADLLAQAHDQLLVALLKLELTNAEGRTLVRGFPEHTVEASRQARSRSSAEPAVWQRGKDRCRKALGEIRSHIAQPARNQFPSEILKILERTDLNLIPDPVEAVPAPIRELLDRMTRDV